MSPETNLPVKWSPTENIAWKLALPQWSGATPIIWGDTIFLNVAESDLANLSLWSVKRSTGEVTWKRHLSSGNNKQRKQNMSSPSPVTDGTTVWAVTGTGFIRTAFDFSGKELWMRDIQKDYGRFGLNWGYANSPLLLDGDLIVPVLHGMKTDDPSYILRIDGKTGQTKWKVERPNQAIRESPDSYTTPALVKVGNAREIVITGADVVTGHDPATGKELWRADGLNPQNDPANPEKWKKVYQDEGQDLQRVNFYPEERDWARLSAISNATGFSRCDIFVFLMLIDMGVISLINGVTHPDTGKGVRNPLTFCSFLLDSSYRTLTRTLKTGTKTLPKLQSTTDPW